MQIELIFNMKRFCTKTPHSRPQSPRSFWPAAGVDSSGLIRFSEGAFVWDQSGIRKIGIMRVSICLGAILIPEYLDFHSGYSTPRSRIAGIYSEIYSGINSYSGISQTNAPWVCSEYSFRILNQSDLPDLKGSPWIAHFRYWTRPELSIPAAGQEGRGLWGREWRTGTFETKVQGNLQMTLPTQTIVLYRGTWN